MLQHYVKIVSTPDPRVFTLPFVLQEKIDGSQFSFGRNEEGTIACRSHHSDLDMDHPEGMFKPAVDYVKSLDLSWVLPGMVFYCEYLSKPKHNAMSYDRIPKNHLMLYDVRIGPVWWGWDSDGLKESDVSRLKESADRLGIEAVRTVVFNKENPFSVSGEEYGWNDLDRINYIMSTWNSDGGQLGGGIEGIVVKNYMQNLVVGSHIQPLMVKFVRPQYKEVQKKEWADSSIAGRIQALMDSYSTEARWAKAVQHLDEQGVLVHEPKDIGPLIREIIRDVMEEEKDNIMKELWDIVWKTMSKQLTRGFPEWYKRKLTEDLELSIMQAWEKRINDGPAL